MNHRPPFSLVVIAAGRTHHLSNLLRGCELSSHPPTEVILVRMDDASPPDTSLPLRPITCPAREGHLPLAAARNTGARAATHDLVLFLDVDCIPGPTYFETLIRHLVETGGLVMGTPRYLQNSVGGDLTESTLTTHSLPHPDRPPLESDLTTTPHYHLFWSLCFGIHRRDFERIGGFDETFTGYGGEDTDFAFTARERGILFHLSSATVYHQPHEITDPPISHLADIVANANEFHKKWQTWPMKPWLTEFRTLGLIRWKDDTPEPAIVIQSPPPELMTRLTRSRPF